MALVLTLPGQAPERLLDVLELLVTPGAVDAAAAAARSGLELDTVRGRVPVFDCRAPGPERGGDGGCVVIAARDGLTFALVTD